jgi:hypothetical protein
MTHPFMGHVVLAVQTWNCVVECYWGTPQTAVYFSKSKTYRLLLLMDRALCSGAIIIDCGYQHKTFLISAEPLETPGPCIIPKIPSQGHGGDLLSG